MRVLVIEDELKTAAYTPVVRRCKLILRTFTILIQKPGPVNTNR